MKKEQGKKTAVGLAVKNEKISLATIRKTRIERLKEMINNEEYVNEAISKLANSLTSGLMK